MHGKKSSNREIVTHLTGVKFLLLTLPSNDKSMVKKEQIGIVIIYTNELIIVQIQFSSSKFFFFKNFFFNFLIFTRTSSLSKFSNLKKNNCWKF